MALARRRLRVARSEAGRSEAALAVNPSPWSPPPEGFALTPLATGALYTSEAMRGEIERRGLTTWADWEGALAEGRASSGRGKTAVLSGWRLKMMRRGGWLAPLLRNRYPTARRLVRQAQCAVGRVHGVRSRKPRGKVIAQAPRAGATRTAEARVGLVVSRGRR